MAVQGSGYLVFPFFHLAPNSDSGPALAPAQERSCVRALDQLVGRVPLKTGTEAGSRAEIMKLSAFFISCSNAPPCCKQENVPTVTHRTKSANAA